MKAKTRKFLTGTIVAVVAAAALFVWDYQESQDSIVIIPVLQEDGVITGQVWQRRPSLLAALTFVPVAGQLLLIGMWELEDVRTYVTTAAFNPNFDAGLVPVAPGTDRPNKGDALNGPAWNVASNPAISAYAYIYQDKDENGDRPDVQCAKDKRQEAARDNTLLDLRGCFIPTVPPLGVGNIFVGNIIGGQYQSISNPDGRIINTSTEVGLAYFTAQTLSADDVSNFCLDNECGNGCLDPGEECDDGDPHFALPATADRNSDTVADACRLDCTNAGCGDGVVDTGEDCDDPDGNSDTEADTCRTDCTNPRCGDGVIDPGRGESCDEGDEFNGQPGHCNATCTGILPAVCGDGIVQLPEDCDDGVETATCDDDCTFVRCGDLNTNEAAGEQCDDGCDKATPGDCQNPQDNFDGCTATCQNNVCGDGFVWVGQEECDVGSGSVCNISGNVACLAACTPGAGEICVADVHIQSGLCDIDGFTSCQTSAACSGGADFCRAGFCTGGDGTTACETTDQFCTRGRCTITQTFCFFNEDCQAPGDTCDGIVGGTCGIGVCDLDESIPCLFDNDCSGFPDFCRAAANPVRAQEHCSPTCRLQTSESGCSFCAGTAKSCLCGEQIVWQEEFRFAMCLPAQSA